MITSAVNLIKSDAQAVRSGLRQEAAQPVLVKAAFILGGTFATVRHLARELRASR